jgi:SAM-dependent MidA family methyltransferase
LAAPVTSTVGTRARANAGAAAALAEALEDSDIGGQFGAMATTPSLTSHPISDGAVSLSDALGQQIRAAVEQAGGWIGFDVFMAMALYTPGLGYYANSASQIGTMPQGLPDASGALHGAGSDFVTAPELTPLFGATLAQQVAQALQETQTFDLWEFGAGTGALARQLLDALAAMGQPVDSYTIVDISGSLRERQQQTLAGYAAKVRWVDTLPQAMEGVIVGNEVLDAMPVQLLARTGGNWCERGVVLAGDALAWGDRPTDRSPPLEIEGPHDYLTETHAQGEAFIRTLADRMTRGAVFLIDYGFPEAEYYHPQRHMGTVMCHRAHQSDGNALADVGLKDITAHVNFTGIALAAQDAGFEVLGYTSQANFLINCGVAAMMQDAPLPQRVAAQKLLLEHEMGELFKVIGLVRGTSFAAMGFAQGDRTHRL